MKQYEEHTVRVDAKRGSEYNVTLCLMREADTKAAWRLLIHRKYVRKTSLL